MNRIPIKNLVLPAIVVAAGLLAMQATRQKQLSDAQERLFSENLNLALRRTAHRLYASAGNRTDAIPPVGQDGAYAWTLRLERPFNYDSLPVFLRESFARHRVEGRYNVTLIDCWTEELALGYAANTFEAGDEVPCMGREQKTGCYDLHVTFVDRADAPASGVLIGLAATAGCLLAFGAARLIYRRPHRSTKISRDPEQEQLTESHARAEEAILRFSQSAFDFTNQKLVVRNITKDLTYREAKLLRLFCDHTNQLLSREQILQSVWGDEGILVGRSVDVFVSRLRKLLQEDPSVRFTNVHGVGYRMEVAANSLL